MEMNRREFHELCSGTSLAAMCGNTSIFNNGASPEIADEVFPIITHITEEIDTLVQQLSGLPLNGIEQRFVELLTQEDFAVQRGLMAAGVNIQDRLAINKKREELSDDEWKQMCEHGASLQKTNPIPSLLFTKPNHTVEDFEVFAGDVIADEILHRAGVDLDEMKLDAAQHVCAHISSTSDRNTIFTWIYDEKENVLMETDDLARYAITEAIMNPSLSNEPTSYNLCHATESLVQRASEQLQDPQSSLHKTFYRACRKWIQLEVSAEFPHISELQEVERNSHDHTMEAVHSLHIILSIRNVHERLAGQIAALSEPQDDQSED